MRREEISPRLASQIKPRALCVYAEGVGWLPVTTSKPNGVAIFHRPESQTRQLLVPLDEQFDDYGEAVAEAVRRLAEFENRPAHEVLEHLLLPPAAVLRFREASPDAEAGS